VPGRHINDQQVRTYMRLRTDHTQATAAAKAGLSVATARRIDQDRRPWGCEGFSAASYVKGQRVLGDGKQLIPVIIG